MNYNFLFLCFFMPSLNSLAFDDFFIFKGTQKIWKSLSEVNNLLASTDKNTLNSLRQEKYIQYKGESIPLPDNGSSLLFPAINLTTPIADASNNQTEHLALVSTLLIHGLDPNIQNNKNETALTKLIDLNFSSNYYGTYTEDILKLLLQHGATIDLNAGTIPLWLRAAQISPDDPEVASLLLADPPLMEALRARDDDTVEKLIKDPAQIVSKNNNGDTPLHLITGLSYVYTLYSHYIPNLLSPITVNVQNKQGNTPFYTFITCTLEKSKGYSIISQKTMALLQAFFEAEASLDIVNNKEETPRSVLLKSYKAYPVQLQEFLQKRGVTPINPTILYNLAEALDTLLKSTR